MSTPLTPAIRRPLRLLSWLAAFAPRSSRTTRLDDLPPHLLADLGITTADLEIAAQSAGYENFRTVLSRLLCRNPL